MENLLGFPNFQSFVAALEYNICIASQHVHQANPHFEKNILKSPALNIHSIKLLLGIYNNIELKSSPFHFTG